MNVLYTAGYQAWTPAQLLAEATRLGAMVLDIRYSAHSYRPEWGKEALRELLGSGYLHVPAFGNKNYKGGTIELAMPKRGLPIVQEQLEYAPVILLCACRDWQTCHRAVAAEYIQEALGCTVEHLEPPVDVAPGTMPVLTLTPPWGTLIAIGAKHIETRSWSTNYRGRIAIHQAKGTRPIGGDQGLMELCRSEPFRSVLVGAGYLGTPALPRGAIVATAELIKCMSTDWLSGTGRTTVLNSTLPVEFVLNPQERAFGDYSAGRYAWLLADVKALPEPIPARGGQGLWRWQYPEGFEQ